MPKQESRILGAVGDQVETILRLEKVVENLALRLNPVLQPMPPLDLTEPDEPEEKIRSNSELYELINANREKIANITNLLESVISRLEL